MSAPTPSLNAAYYIVVTLEKPVPAGLFSTPISPNLPEKDICRFIFTDRKEFLSVRNSFNGCMSNPTIKGSTYHCCYYSWQQKAELIAATTEEMQNNINDYLSFTHAAIGRFGHSLRTDDEYLTNNIGFFSKYTEDELNEYDKLILSHAIAAYNNK